VIIAKIDPKTHWSKRDDTKVGQINLKVGSRCYARHSRAQYLRQIDQTFTDLPLRRCVKHWATRRCIMQYVRSLRARDMSLEDAAREEGVDLSSEAVRRELD
jgi:hypothetical protein